MGAGGKGDARPDPRAWKSGAPDWRAFADHVEPARMAARTASISPDDLTEAQAKAELARLGREIAGHDRRYYQDDAPTVSDAEYDALRQPGGLRRCATRCRCCRSTTPSATTTCASSSAASAASCACRRTRRWSSP